MVKHIEVIYDSDLIFIIVKNPPVNALNGSVIDELGLALDQINKDESLKVVIITGEGEKAFIAGADIKEFPDLDKNKGYEFSRRGQIVFDKIANHPYPVIAAINGFALGGGLEVALACDIRVISENAKVGFPEVTLGIIPGYAGTQRLPRVIGVGKAKELIFSGAIIDGQEAYQIGLADYIVPRDQVINKAKELSYKIINAGPIAVKAAKKAINMGLETNLENGQELEASLFANLCETNDQKEGARAFLEKRTPKFKGN